MTFFFSPHFLWSRMHHDMFVRGSYWERGADPCLRASFLLVTPRRFIIEHQNTIEHHQVVVLWTVSEREACTRALCAPSNRQIHMLSYPTLLPIAPKGKTAVAGTRSENSYVSPVVLWAHKWAKWLHNQRRLGGSQSKHRMQWDTALTPKQHTTEGTVTRDIILMRDDAGGGSYPPPPILSKFSDNEPRSLSMTGIEALAHTDIERGKGGGGERGGPFTFPQHWP